MGERRGVCRSLSCFCQLCFLPDTWGLLFIRSLLSESLALHWPLFSSILENQPFSTERKIESQWVILAPVSEIVLLLRKARFLCFLWVFTSGPLLERVGSSLPLADGVSTCVGCLTCRRLARCLDCIVSLNPRNSLRTSLFREEPSRSYVAYSFPVVSFSTWIWAPVDLLLSPIS